MTEERERHWKPQQLADQAGELLGESGGFAGQLWSWGNRLTRLIIIATVFPLALAGFALGGTARAVAVFGILITLTFILRGLWRVVVALATLTLAVLIGWSTGFFTNLPAVDLRAIGVWIVSGASIGDGNPALPLGTLVSFAVLLIAVPPLIWVVPLFWKKGSDAMRVPATIIGAVLALTALFSVVLVMREQGVEVDWKLAPIIFISALAVLFLSLGLTSGAANFMRRVLALVIVAATLCFVLGGVGKTAQKIGSVFTAPARALSAASTSAHTSAPTPAPPRVAVTRKSWDSSIEIRTVTPEESPCQYHISKGGWSRVAFRVSNGNKFVVKTDPPVPFAWWWSSGITHPNPTAVEDGKMSLKAVFPNGTPPSDTFRIKNKGDYLTKVIVSVVK